MKLFQILHLFKIHALVYHVELINITSLTNEVATREIIKTIGVLFNLIYGLKFAKHEP